MNIRGTNGNEQAGPPTDEWGQRPYLETYGPVFPYSNGNGLFLFAGYAGESTVISNDMDMTVFSLGRYDVSAFFLGEGRHVAFAAGGNNIFAGGAGSNLFFDGPGNSLLAGGSGDSRLNGGGGSDTLMFGQWDQATGGPGADRFVPMMKAAPAGSMFITDLSFRAGDTLDLTMLPEVTRANLEVRDDALVCHAPGGDIFIQGAGHQIEIVGGVDAAVKAGYLSVFGDYLAMG